LNRRRTKGVERRIRAAYAGFDRRVTLADLYNFFERKL
jgi:hypothetical protein